LTKAREFLLKAEDMLADDWPDEAGRAAYLAGSAMRARIPYWQPSNCHIYVIGCSRVPFGSRSAVEHEGIFSAASAAAAILAAVPCGAGREAVRRDGPGRDA
jgi:hypothetical protein